MPPYMLKIQGTDIANDKTYNSELDTACVNWCQRKDSIDLIHVFVHCVELKKKKSGINL